MFREAIGIVNPVTGEYLQKYSRLINEPDYSLTMLGLACFKKKVPDYNGIAGLYKTGFTTQSEALNGFHVFYKRKTPEQIGFYYLTYTIVDGLDEKDEVLVANGFKHKESVEKIIAAKFQGSRTDVLYSTKDNAVVILTNRYGLDLYHLVLSFLPLYYPNIYNKPISKEDPEVEVLSSLSKNSGHTFRLKIAEILSEFKTEFCKAQIAGLLQMEHQRKIEDATREVDRARAAMEDLMTRYVRACESFNEAKVRKEGVLRTEESPEWEEELINYLCSNEKIRNVNVNGSEIYFTVATTLQQFSTDTWDLFSRNGGIYDGKYNGEYATGLTCSEGVFADRANRKRLLDAIFSENAQFEVKVAGNYMLNIRNNFFETNSGFNYEEVDPIYTNYLPNPHLKLFACLGQYHGRVVGALERGDMLTAFELCVHSAGSVDLDEVEQTFRPFIGWILKSDRKILRRNDGVDMTPGEALLWLVDKEKE